MRPTDDSSNVQLLILNNYSLQNRELKLKFVIPLCMAANRACHTKEFNIVRLLLANKRIKITLTSLDISKLLFLVK